VSRRRREIGIRMALGAQPGTVRALVVGDGGRLALAGVVLGLALALGSTRALGALLFGVHAMDPAVYAAAAFAVLIAAFAASWIPARVATRVQPLEVLGR
jgi:ABC-type antimicrobial peptide transport system permease subunit